MGSLRASISNAIAITTRLDFSKQFVLIPSALFIQAIYFIWHTKSRRNIAMEFIGPSRLSAISDRCHVSQFSISAVGGTV